MKDRILQIRKSAKMTQAAMAERLGLTENFIWMLEHGKKVPSDRTITDICREFGVSESWLREGTGEMLVPLSKNEQLGQFFGEILSTEPEDFRHRLVAALARLDPGDWETLAKLARELTE